MIFPSQSQSRKRFQGSNVIPSSVVLEMLSLETTMYFLNIPSSCNALSHRRSLFSFTSFVVLVSMATSSPITKSTSNEDCRVLQYDSFSLRLL